jgi:RHS repeat-associated protein
MYNGHADVTALLDTAGNVVATYYYDAFGNILAQTGTVNNSILYTGYQYDKETGLYYLNARMYDPITARFMQEDTYTGEHSDPLSLNLYTYCKNKPLIYSDPTGHNTMEDYKYQTDMTTRANEKKYTSMKEKGEAQLKQQQHQHREAVLQEISKSIAAKPSIASVAKETGENLLPTYGTISTQSSANVPLSQEYNDSSAKLIFSIANNTLSTVQPSANVASSLPTVTTPPTPCPTPTPTQTASTQQESDVVSQVFGASHSDSFDIPNYGFSFPTDWSPVRYVEKKSASTETGDSSKPVSVYADNFENNLLESTCGLKYNVGQVTEDIGFGLTDAGVSFGYKSGENSYSLKRTTSPLKIGYSFSNTTNIDPTNSVTITRGVEIDTWPIVLALGIVYCPELIPIAATYALENK